MIMKRAIICLLGIALSASAEQKQEVRPLVYTNNFEGAAVSTVPTDVMVLGGEFTVKSDGTNHVFELPGAPLDSFAAQFGPAAKDSIAVMARISGTAKGRRAPTFGLGLGGVSGWKLQVAPSKKTIELLKDQELKASATYEWKSGTWTEVQLTILPPTNGVWRIAGKVWSEGAVEPRAAIIHCDDKEEPVSGKASILGSPFAGTPILFDDLKVVLQK